MKTNYPNELLNLSKRVVWFEEPEQILPNSKFFLSYVMTYGSLEDILIAKKYFSTEDFKNALKYAPAGIFDPRSWSYWNIVYDNIPVPKMPQRNIS